MLRVSLPDRPLARMRNTPVCGSIIDSCWPTVHCEPTAGFAESSSIA